MIFFSHAVQTKVKQSYAKKVRLLSVLQTQL